MRLENVTRNTGFGGLYESPEIFPLVFRNMNPIELNLEEAMACLCELATAARTANGW